MQSLGALPKSSKKRVHKDGYMLEIAAYDLHLGKIGIMGDLYSLEIAQDRMLTAIDDLLEKSKGWVIDKIVFVVGNDLLNVDKAYPFPSTTAGTPQNISDPLTDIYRSARKLLIQAINYLAEKAFVQVVVIPGNHDKESMFHLGDSLDLYYDSCLNVEVDNGASMMKSYKHGNSLLVFDHGDKVKPQHLPGVIMTRFRDILSEVKYIEVHRGHIHRTKTHVIGLEEDEFNGLIVRNLSSMSATDQWHDDNGFVGSVKRAHAFVWSYHNGLQAQLLYNVPVD
jgi:hypothetical protein